MWTWIKGLFKRQPAVFPPVNLKLELVDEIIESKIRLETLEARKVVAERNRIERAALKAARIAHYEKQDWYDGKH